MEKIEKLKWQCWFKGLAVGIFLGLGIQALIGTWWDYSCIDPIEGDNAVSTPAICN